MLVSIGADPIPDAVADDQLPTIAKAITDTLRSWQDGSIVKKIQAGA
ncbi:hypothetical protein CCP2SC5_2550002 [Azospirillaceae bacterium]